MFLVFLTVTQPFSYTSVSLELADLPTHSLMPKIPKFQPSTTLHLPIQHLKLQFLHKNAFKLQ
jgi:hypothetical protein